jgi:hypothetical protein
VTHAIRRARLHRKFFAASTVNMIDTFGNVIVTNMTGSLSIAARAAYILRDNSNGRITKASPTLYPHQWSWDAAFNAIGLATIDLPRARLELDSLFAGQWRNGLLPHIVFDPNADGYWPGPAQWECATHCEEAPTAPATSGIIDPPVHAIAVDRIPHAGVGGWHLSQAAGLAPVSRPRPGRQGNRPADAVPWLGIRHRQFTPLGRSVRRGRGGARASPL